ncbi:MAG: hypothetical protein IJH87_05390 [Atopobiaceae bacterium]|nr:hypothetical protein [Atopobiaceae bacterium]
MKDYSESNFNEILEILKTGNPDAVHEALRSDEPLLRYCGISAAAMNSLNDSATVDLIRGLLDDRSSVYGSAIVGDFAVAALDILNGQKYQGDRRWMRDAISSGLSL